ncbi:MAG: class II aldolase/adducin family protein [Patescibacteria group bacterium]|nr:class II aldolase/adducin family protein [Patescibacteria group bacterium]
MDYDKLFKSDGVQAVASQICELARECWVLQLSDSTGFSISCDVGDNIVISDKTGTGFRRNRITPSDLIMIDLDANFIYSPDQSDTRKAPVNVVIHLEGFKKSDARACIHWHDPYTNAFTCLGKTIKPFTLQSKLIGDVECIVVDDREEKEAHLKEITQLIVPTGLHCRQDVYFIMKKVGIAMRRVLERRNEEFDKHGIVSTHFEHGLFSFGRNLGEAFDNGYRSVRNAQAIIYSRLL